MDGQDKALSGVLSGITAERIKSVLIELARIPSPLTELFEAEPQLRQFIDTAVAPRLRHIGITDIRRDPMGNLLATWSQRNRPRVDAGDQRHEPAGRHHAEPLWW